MLTEYLPRSGEKAADCLIKREGLLNKKWSYDYGVVWRGMEMLYALTGKRKYFDYIREALDGTVDADGTIAGYSREAYNLDYLNNGRQIIFLYQQTGEEKYKKAGLLSYSFRTKHIGGKDGISANFSACRFCGGSLYYIFCHIRIRSFYRQCLCL